MSVSLTRRWMVCMLVLVIAGVGSATYQPLWGQEEEPAQEQAQPTDRRQRRQPRGRLPAYYAQVVSGNQREEVYKIQRSYAPKIRELMKQIEELQAQRDKEIEAVLTPEQRERVEQLREEARKRREQRAAQRRREAQSGGDSTE